MHFEVENIKICTFSWSQRLSVRRDKKYIKISVMWKTFCVNKNIFHILIHYSRFEILSTDLLHIDILYESE